MYGMQGFEYTLVAVMLAILVLGAVFLCLAFQGVLDGSAGPETLHAIVPDGEVYE